MSQRADGGRHPSEQGVRALDTWGTKAVSAILRLTGIFPDLVE